MGLDGITTWFLRVGTPIFAAPLALLFEQSIAAGIIPSQWKAVIINSVPKIRKPETPSDYRAITITAVQSQLLEQHVVHSFIYPVLQQQQGLMNGRITWRIQA